MFTELLIGCGSRREKFVKSSAHPTWENLVTCDYNIDHYPDVVCDLNQIPWPFADESFDEIHAYDVMEHLGTQGDWKAFFDQFGEVYRILKEDGTFYGRGPYWTSEWAFGDPSHTRIINARTLLFLDQQKYAQVGQTAMSDFRFYWKGNLKAVFWENNDTYFDYILKKV